MNTVKLEIFMIIISTLIIGGLGLRAKAETEIVSQANNIIELEKQVNIETRQVAKLKELLKPLEYSQPLDQIRISSATGVRRNPMGGGTESLHEGVDLRGKKGDPVNAVLAGTVVENWLPPGWYDGEWFSGHKTYGGYIVLNHGNQVFTKYGHLSRTLVHEDMQVEAGQKIGEMGNTGISTGIHLHFEIVVNPFKYLQERR